MGKGSGVTRDIDNDSKNQDKGWSSRLGFKGKTLWDGLNLIGIPLALAFVGFYLANLQDQRQERIEENRITAQSTIEASRANANALESYLDDMSAILLKEDLEDKKTITVAQARTISVLSELDGVRNGRVFLHITLW